jgi:endonuclease/exonuclease/phosphatase (EEP) superfamily protein YafD
MTLHPPSRHRISPWRRPLVAGLTGLLLAGCLTIPSEPRTLTAGADGRLLVHRTDCATRDPGLQPVAASTLGGDTVQLALWNIHKEEHPSWEADFARVSAGADLLLLQEARNTDSLRRGLGDRRYRWTLNAAFQYQGEDTGVLTAAGARAESWCSLRTAEPWLRIPKTALVTRYRLANGELLSVVNVHGINFALGTREFRGQLEALRERLARHDGPVIVAGDFNTWSGERHEIVAAMARELGLTAVSYEQDKRSRFLGEPVDHVYYRGLRAEPAQVVTVGSSDHHAVRVTFRIDTTRLATLPPADTAPEPRL